jgi:hypothetical protein
MFLITGTITLFSRLIGGVASSTVGWATLLLFGRVPQSKQRLLNLMAFASVLWLLCLIAIISPAFEKLIVTSVPHPGFVAVTWFGFAVLLGAIFLPAFVGAATVILSNDRKPLAAAGHLLRGYPLTVVLLGTILFLAAWSVVRSIRSAQRGWQSLHIPMMVKPDRYEAVVEDIGAALADAGLGLERTTAPPWFVVPPKVLALVGGLSSAGLVPDELVAFKSDDLRVLVYLSDVALIGKTDQVARARSAIVGRLTFTDAYLTATKEAEQVEDALRRLAERNATSAADFADVDHKLESLDVDFGDWLTLYRLRLQVEHEGRASSASTLTRRAS